MAEIDRNQFAEAIRRAVEAEAAATPAGSMAIVEAAKAVQNMTTRLQERAERAREQLGRGSHLTRHRITL